MSKSLRDQLMQSGLVSKQKARETKKVLHKKNKQTAKKLGKKLNPIPYDLQEAPEERADRIKEAKKARDQALEAKRKANTVIREKHAQVRQLIKAHSVERSQGDESFQFILPATGKAIKKMLVNTEQYKKLCNGQLAVVYFQEQFCLVKPEGAAKIAERDADIVYRSEVSTRSSGDDPEDPYAGYEIPDDLVW